MATLVKAKTLNLIISLSQVSGKGERADRVLSRLEGLPSRSQLKAWLSDGCVKRGLETVGPNTLLRDGDAIQIAVPEVRKLHLEPRKVEFKIYFEDDDLIVLYKPKGISMHPGAGRRDETTLVHGLLYHTQNLSEAGGEFRPGIVHRLDKDTEGIVVVAKTNEIHAALSKQFSDRKIDRAYWALCWGRFPKEQVIEAPIGRSPRDRKKMAVVTTGRAAKTTVRILQFFDEGYSWVECKLHTGRTHQIRVHMSHIKFGLLGDLEYSKKRMLKWSHAKEAAYENLRGQALVAFRLGFVHPRTQEPMKFEAEKPEWLQILTTK